METQIGPTNVNNVIRENIVDGKIRFVGREGSDNGCQYGTNYFLVNSGLGMPSRTVADINIVGDEVVLVYTGIKKERLGIDSKSYKRLKKSPKWKSLKKFVVKMN